MKATVEKRSVVLAAAAIALLFAFVFKGLIATTPVTDRDEFDGPRAAERLARILGDEQPHPVDSDANDAVRERLLAEIRAIGFEPEIRDDFTCRGSAKRNYLSCARVRNVVATAGPPTGGAILVASHYDSVPAGPGAGDDGAGVAAALEIASILKKRSPSKGVIFLFTDGEEAGLLGAHSFVQKDPLAKRIDAVINMEARGAAGPAILFETSSPNGRDIAGFARRAARPVANSLATNIYKLLPNDTDVSEFLALNSDAVNFAFNDRLPLYHTPLDNLANLDPKSLDHLGASALAALDGFLRDIDHADGADEGDYVFADLLSRTLIVAPTLGAVAMILLGLVASVAAFFSIRGQHPLRTALAPLAAIAGAAFLSWAATALIGAVRPEPAYWHAAPVWTRAVIYLSALAAAFGAIALSVGADRMRLLAASWFWFAVFGVVAFIIAPGSALLTGLPLALFAAAPLASVGAPRLLAPISLGGFVAMLVLWLPALHYAEIGLGLGGAWPFAAIAALIMMLALPVVTDGRPLRLAIVLAPAGALIAALILASTAPAYSPAAPRPLNIQAISASGDGDGFIAVTPTGAPPPAGLDRADEFARQEIKGLKGERFAIRAPIDDIAEVGILAAPAGAAEAGRRMTLTLTANGADEIVLIAPAESNLASIAAAGETHRYKEGEEVSIRCAGRACATFDLIVDVGAEPQPWSVLGIRYGLDGEAEAIAKSRPDDATAIQTGDIRIGLQQAEI